MVPLASASPANARSMLFSLRLTVCCGLTPARKKHLDALDLEGLHHLREYLVQHRRWPRYPAEMDQSENKDIKDSELTYFGRLVREGELEGELRGALKEARCAIEVLCTVFELRLTKARKQHVSALDLAGLHSLRDHLVQHRRWPR